jgi:hypothetical protein
MGHQHVFGSEENIMGNSLHHKIYLGRRSAVLESKPVQAMLLVAIMASLGLVWLAIRNLP